MNLKNIKRKIVYTVIESVIYSVFYLIILKIRITKNERTN